MDLENLQTTIVDARGVSCPGPLLEAKKGIGQVDVGGVIEIYSSDPGTGNDLPAWCNKVGHEFLGSLEGEGYTRYFIKRTM